MKHWKRIIKKNILSFPAWTGGVFFVALALIGIRMVLAGNDIKTIYIFPTEIKSIGWENENLALGQDLSARAIASDFTKENSAYAMESGHADSLTAGSGEADPSDNGTTENNSSAGDAESEINIDGQTGVEKSADVPVEEENSAQNVNASAPEIDSTPEITPASETVSTPVLAPTPADDSQSLLSFPKIISLFQNFATPLFAQEFPKNETSTALVAGEETATTEPEIETTGETATGTPAVADADEPIPAAENVSEPDKKEDVSVCAVKEKNCHTMELSGFGIENGASLGEIKTVGLRLSLGGKGLAAEGESDRLFIKYFYNGEWYLADAISLDKEISNSLNGGHFLYALPEIKSWDELAGIKIFAEYDRNENTPAEIYIDGAWLDVSFKTAEDAPSMEEKGNVSSFLRAGEESNNPDILQIGAGKKILFSYGSPASSKGFVIKSDKSVYEGLSNQTVYFSVTNTSDKENNFSLSAYFPENGGDVKALRRWTRNVPYEATVSEYRPLTYFCEEGWTATTTDNGTSPAHYECVSSLQTENCDNLNADKTNCTVKNTLLSGHTETNYQNVWRDAIIREESGNKYLKNIRGIFGVWKADESLPYKAKQSFQGEHLVFPGQTLYFAMDISYPANSRGRFFIEAKDGDAFGLLGPKWRGGWKYRMPAEIGNAANGSEIYAEIDEKVSDFWKSVKKDGGDIRFITADGKELPYWLSEWDYGKKRAGVWFRYENVSSGEVYLYYGNKEAASASDPSAPFLHSSAQDMFRATAASEGVYAGGFSVVSLTDANEIKLSGFEAVPLNRGEAAFFKSFNSSSVVSAKGPAMAYAIDAGRNVWEPIAAPEKDGDVFARKEFGTEFALPADASEIRVFCSSEEEAVLVEVVAPNRAVLQTGTCAGELIFGESDGLNFPTGAMIISSGDAKKPFLAFMKGVGEKKTENFLPLFGAPQSRGTSPETVSVSFGKEELSPVPKTIDDNFAESDMFDALKKRENGLAEEFKYPKLNDRLDDKKDFNAKETPEFRFKYKLQRNPAVQFVRGLFTEKQYSVKGAYISHEALGDVVTSFDVSYGENNEWTLTLGKNAKSIRPGKYTLQIEIDEGGEIFKDEMNFYWGVLAVNTAKAEYASGENVEIDMAALSPNGNTLCDANLALSIVNPSGVAYDVPIIPSGLCDGNNVVSVPDYSAEYGAEELGLHTVKLSRFDDDGNFVAGTANTFEVKETIPFEITRTGPTRIYPLAPYAMTISVKANQNFSGIVHEKLPEGFTLTDSGADSMFQSDDGIEQSWNVNMDAGDTETLTYSFDAPDVSPYLYLLPALRFLEESASTTDTALFEEGRNWQIASDAAGQMIALWDDGASVPANWTCLSCGSGDFYQKFFRGAAAYATSGLGVSTHTPTATGAVADNTTGARNNNGGTNISSTAHHHTYTPVITSASNLPAYRQLRVIRYNSAGEPGTIPAGVIFFFDATVPSGWTDYFATQGANYVYGENTVGTTGGSNTHTHTISGDTDAAYGGTVAAGNGWPRGSAANPTHTHTLTSTATASVNNEPAYISVILGKLNTATTTWRNDYITMWDNAPTDGWTVLSDVGGPLYQKFIKPSSSYGTTGGSDTHATADVSGIATGGANTTVTNRNNGVAANAGTHTHTVDVTNFSVDENLPPYNDVIFAKRQAGIPKFTQEQFAWYVTDTANTPTDPWPAGAENLSEDTPITVNDTPPGNGSVLRLRMSLMSINATTTADAQAFRLQYGDGEDCTTVTSWTDVGGLGSSAKWRGYDNGGISDGDALSETALSLSASAQSYEETNDSVANPAQIDKNTNGEWDFVLEDNAATSSTSYCFRMINSDNTPLYAYNGYPQLITNSAPATTTTSAPFDNEKLANDPPSFDFASVDPEANDMHYQIQIDDNADFSSLVIDNTSTSTAANFNNLIIPADKAPYNNGNTIRFIPSTALSDGATYWWRVRAIDPSGANEWSPWTSAQSFTLTSVSVSTWFQTSYAQFLTDSFSGTRASSTADNLELIPPGTSGYATSTAISFSSGSDDTSTAWGTLSWSSTTPSGSTLKLRLWYYTETGEWALIPESALSGNAAGFTTSLGVNLLGLDESVYGTIKIEAAFTATGAGPQINDWTIAWGSRVSTPVLAKLFNNEKTGTTTPTFEFYASDPQVDDLEYQVQWSSTPTFVASTTRNSNVNAGFTNVSTPADTDPFNSGDTIDFHMQAADALTNGNTYWWRVRAKDPSGGDVYSLWSEARSFTVDTTVTTSTWHQTTNEQFDTDTHANTEASANSIIVSTTAKEAMVAYAQGAVQTPRYRLWNGTAWGSEMSASTVGSTIKWAVLKESPNRDEYVLATIGEDMAVKAQVYENGAWGNMQTIAAALSNTSARGVDVAYESNTGDAVVVACDGDPDPTYYKWNGTSWFESGTVNVATATNCQWVRLASDPVSSSNEIIAITRGSGTAYEAQVWSGSAWGNAATFGGTGETGNEGMAVEYEESGNQAIALSTNGATSGFVWRSWDGSAWSPIPGNAPTGRTFPNSAGDDFEWGTLKRDEGTDAMALCYIDHDLDIGTVFWSGAAFGTNTEHTAAGNAKTGRPVDCEYETNGGRDGYLMAAYSSTANAIYNSWNGAAWAGGAALSNIQDSFTGQTRRTGDGILLSLWFDDVNGRYDFSSWNGTAWSNPLQSLETVPSVTVTPFGEPFMIAPANESLTGRFVSSDIIFTEGDGPFWNTASSTETKPAGSSLLYQIEYYSTSTGAWALVPDSDLASNSAGIGSLPINIRPLNKTVYGQLRMVANFTCASAGNCPSVSDLTVTWAAGITVSGTARNYTDTANVTSGTVAVAKNGTLTGKTGSILGTGEWSIANVNAGEGDVITVFVSGAADANEAIGIAKYDGTEDMSGMSLFERHLSLGSDDNQTIANADIGAYDNSVSSNEDIFYDVSAGNDLTVCSVVTGCFDANIYVKVGNTYRPDSANSGNATAHDMIIKGSLNADANTLNVFGSWMNGGSFTASAGGVVMKATSTTETIDSSGATGYDFYNLTLGQTSGAATWNLGSALVVTNDLAVTYGTLGQNGNNAVNLAGNLTIGASGGWASGTATTTFNGSGTKTWSDSTAAKQDLGLVLVDGSSKTVQFGTNVKATNITIGNDDILDANSGNFNAEVTGNWENNNAFVPRSGTVTFSTTTASHTIVSGSSSFYKVVFQGAGGEWQFTTANATTTSDFTITSGTVTLPGGSLAVGGSFLNNGGAFNHSSATLRMTATASGKSVKGGGSDFHDLIFSGTGGAWTMTDGSATTTNDFTVSAGGVTLPSGILSVGGSFTRPGGTFAHNSGTVKMTSGSGGKSVTPGTSSFYNLTFAGAGGGWTIQTASPTVAGNYTITEGAVTNPTGTLTVTGSYDASGGTFAHANGTVLLNATTTGKTINPGTSPFYTLTVNGANGGWTVSGNATTTANFNLTAANAAADSFTVNSGVTFEVDGTFANTVGDVPTKWTGSTLFLNSGTSYSMNAKTSGSDVYGTLKIGANTKVKGWNTSANVQYMVDPTGYLYLQDHGSMDGDLYIWGNYARSSGTEYWDYAKDFDGTALGGSSRVVNIRFASGASAAFSGGTLELLGGSGATTTVDNQSSGNYSVNVTGGTLNAQYYQFRNMDANGLNISGTPTVTSLSDGDFEVAVNDGTAMTVSSSTISFAANNSKQIWNVRFATTTAIGAHNVTEIGGATSNWWFRNATGNLFGEAFDVDPGGNPGYIKWDDSGYDITVAGTVWSGEEITPALATCAIPNVVKIVVDGGASYSGNCSALDGTYSIPGVQFVGDAVLTIYLNTGGGARGAIVTKTPTGDLSGISIYENRVIVRHEDVTPITIANMAMYDSSDDADIPFAAASAATDTLTLSPETELHIWDNKTFIPGGNITLESGGSGNIYDGRLHIGNNAVFTATGSESHSVGGNFQKDNGATFTAANSTFTMTATTTGKIIIGVAAPTFWNLIFNGTGGDWSLNSSIIVSNTLTPTAGTISGVGSITVGAADLSGNGVFNMSGGTVTLNAGGNFGGANDWKFYGLTFGNGTTVATTTKTGANDIEIGNKLTIAASHGLDADASDWTITGAGTSFVKTGYLDADTSLFKYSTTTATNITAAPYYKLELSPAGSGAPTYTLLAGNLSAADTLTVGDGTNPVSVNATTNDPNITVGGNFLISANAAFTGSNSGNFAVGGNFTNNGTFSHGSGTVTMNAGSVGKTIQAGSSSFYNLTLNNANGGWTITGNATTTHDFNLVAATDFTQTSGTTLEVDGTFANSVGGAATEWGGTTLYLNSGTSYSMNEKTAGEDAYGTLRIGNGTNVKMWNSTSTIYSVNANGSLYSQDHNGTDGSLSIWGSYARSSGGEYWSYATDFDGTALGVSRRANVRFASGASATFSGGTFDMLGDASATTTVDVQSAGNYAVNVTGGTLNAQYYQFRNMDANGMNLSGSPAVTNLSDGDFELAVNGGTAMKVAGTVFTANPLKTFMRMRFATTTAIGGYNITATGSTVESWRFNNHTGNLSGEYFDVDPGGDPGYLVWDDSAGAITVAGYIYSDEGVTASTVCAAADSVHLIVKGTSTAPVSFTTSCDGSGHYSFTNIAYNPLDTLTVYLDGVSKRAVTIAADPVTNISDMNLYEHRVILRHQDVFPFIISKLARYDSSDDADIPFTATLGTTDTLVVAPETELHIWDGKTFAPAGNITLQSGGSGDVWDGRLHIGNNAVFTAAGSESHSVGGNFQRDAGATFTAANSTFTFTATTTGKFIVSSVSGLTFASTTFNGAGGGWTFSNADATTTSSFTITNGSVALPSGTLAVGGSFNNNGGTFTHGSGTVKLTGTESGKIVRAGGSDFANLLFNGTGGTWTMPDANATTTNDFTISAGTVTAPSGILSVGGSFQKNGGTFTHNSGTVKFIATSAGKVIFPGDSPFANILFNGEGGEWAFTTADATTTAMTAISAGTVTLPSGVFAVGGGFVNSGAFIHNGGTVKMNATATGKFITAGSSLFNNLTLNGTGGGWTITDNATTTGNFTLTTASSFTQSSGTMLEVGEIFTQGIAGANTTWTGSTLYLNSASNYSINTKALGGDSYGTLKIGANTDIRMWNSTSTTYLVDASGSLYSQKHNGASGDLYIWGDYQNSGSDYWDYAKDFDGTALGGSSRTANVRFFSGASATFSGGTLEIIGDATHATNINNQGSGTYAMNISGGTLNAQYYQFRNMGTSGLNISGTPVITSLSNGDFTLDSSGGTMITVTGGALDQNAGLQISSVSFATSTGVSSGYNVTLSGTTVNAWTFLASTGNYDGEAYDSDGGDECGAIRWSDSACLFLDQTHYRWRNDNGGEGVPSASWYDADWSKRKKIRISNSTGSALSDFQVKVEIPYDADMQSDFDDLRFTDSSGTTTIPYWMESYISSATSTVWLKASSIPASGSADVYMYYGNVAVSTTGSASNVFIFYDGFEDDNISEYSGDASLFDTDTTFNYEWSYGLDAGANTTQKTTDGIYQTGTTVSQGNTMRFFQYVDTSAGADDESCALFGVQSPGSNNNNYALCFELFGTDHITIGKNIANNDTSGTQLATKNVTWATGWYQAVIDWKTDNTIYASVYNNAGTLFATTTATDSSYTSGGTGFSFWGQHGGWDYYAARQYISAVPTYAIGSEQVDGGASWLAAEDTALSNQTPGENLRLRFTVANTGTPLTNQTYALEIASKSSYPNCASVPAVDYSEVPTETGGCGTGAACMSTSANIANHEATGELLSPPAVTSFLAGEVLEDPSNQGNAMDLAANKHTEMEYNFQLTDYATANAYCFRVSDDGSDLDSYSKVAEVTLLFAPTLSNLKFNNDSNIGLMEGSTKRITATASSTDLNGWENLSYATSTFYRSGVSAACAANENNCYHIESASCSFSGCLGNTCDVTCGADIQYFADPTDDGDFVGQDWNAELTIADATAYKDTDTSIGVDLYTLRALTASNDIDYGSLYVGSTTESTNQVTTLRNTGNGSVAVLLDGSDLVGAGGSIPVNEQKYSSTTFTYGSCSLCGLLTGVSTRFDVNLPKPTTTTPVTDNLYWGINIPFGTSAETHHGTNNFMATGP